MESLTLSEDQSQAYCEIMDYIFNRDSKAYVLSGVAGTGKTTLIGMLLRRLHVECQINIVCLAFTGRASSVLIDVGRRFDTSNWCSTIHSFLYKAETDPKTQQIVFIKKPRTEIKTMCDILFVDESQMVSRKLFDDLMELDMPIVFFGDKEQLPPVTDDGDTFNVMDAANFHMTHIQRQAADNPIIGLSKTIRERGIINKRQASDEVQFIKMSDITVDYLRDADVDVILTGTNKQRKKYNEVARCAAGRTERYAVPGDTIVCLANTESQEQYYLANGERFKVRSVSDIRTVYHKRTPIEYRQYEIFRAEGSDRKPAYVNIPESCWEEDAPGFLRLEPMVERTRMGLFAYGYAMSVWKACGSEFGKVLFVDEDVAFFVERRKFRYTAVTRAKNKLIVAQGNT